MGPLLLARLMDLNDTQEGVLNIAFKLADEEGLLLLDLKDLQALLAYIAEHAERTRRSSTAMSPRPPSARSSASCWSSSSRAGRCSSASRRSTSADLMRTTIDGRGIVNVLAADKLMKSPRLYATFLLWLLSELFEELPEIGDPEKPKLVFFFDEAHLLFNEAPKALLDKIEQVVRLIRSKGVGVYFVTQNPLDVPETVLAQLGNRVQHALRAYTPRDQKAVKVAADTFRPNPAFSTYDAITQLGVGEALVSTLEAKGVPSIVERTLIRPPSSRIGTITEDERQKCIATDPIGAMYDKTVDREFRLRNARRAGGQGRRHQGRGAAARRHRRRGRAAGAAAPAIGDRRRDRRHPRHVARHRDGHPQAPDANPARHPRSDPFGRGEGGRTGRRRYRPQRGRLVWRHRRTRHRPRRPRQHPQALASTPARAAAVRLGTPSLS